MTEQAFLELLQPLAEQLKGVALDDEYARYQRAELGRMGADLWYAGQVLRSVPVLLGASLRRGGSVRLDLRTLARRLRRDWVSGGATALTLALTLGAGASVGVTSPARTLRTCDRAELPVLTSISAAPLSRRRASNLT